MCSGYAGGARDIPYTYTLCMYSKKGTVAFEKGSLLLTKGDSFSLSLSYLLLARTKRERKEGRKKEGAKGLFPPHATFSLFSFSVETVNQRARGALSAGVLQSASEGPLGCVYTVYSCLVYYAADTA